MVRTSDASSPVHGLEEDIMSIQEQLSLVTWAKDFKKGGSKLILSTVQRQEFFTEFSSVDGISEYCRLEEEVQNLAKQL